MKTGFLLFISILLVSNTLCAQGSKKYQRLKKSDRYAEGYIILNSDTTSSHGLIKLQYVNDNLFFSVVKFINKNGVAFEFVAMDVNEFGFDNKKFISNGIDFLELIFEGNKIQLYKMMYEDFTDLKVTHRHKVGTGMNTMDMTSTSDVSLKSVTKRYMIRKTGEEKLIEVNRRNFKEIFNEQFQDCEKIINRIKSEKVRYKDAESIIIEYNDCDQQPIN